MAGGNWTGQNQVRAGAYVNVKSDGIALSVSGERGVVTMPWIGSFGAVGEIIELTPMSNFLHILGYEFGAPEMLTIRETFKRASRILLFRVSAGTVATVTSNDLTVTANHPGKRGNDISIRVIADIDNIGTFIVQTFLDTLQVDEQRAERIQDLQANSFVKFNGTGTLSVSAGIRLTGGVDNPATTGSFADYFEALETYEFNTMALPVGDTAVKTLAVAYIHRQRSDEGKKCQLAVAGVYADSEAVINIRNGVILEDGTEVNADLATAWVAGATAGANVNESNTYSEYDGAMDVTERLTNTEIEQSLRSGEFVFIERRGRVVVEQDINSLVSFTAEKNQSFGKNRVIRVIDAISNDIRNLFANSFIGRVTNNHQGRTVFRDAVINYLTSLQNMGAIENFGAEDVVVQAGETKDSIVVDLAVQPTDAMEKAYIIITVQ